MRFFTGLDSPSHAQHFDAVFISINRIRNRKGPFAVGDWIMDSGAFMEISTYGEYRTPVAAYANQIARWKDNGNLLAAVSQDYMCEPFILEKNGMTVADHQRLTIERYDELLRYDPGVYIMPVLQGYEPKDYVAHVRQYGTRLKHGAWVGVGSVCKRNSNAKSIEDVLVAIKSVRPDLRLHGFGIKTTALSSSLVQFLLDTSDSMAWSYAARREGRDQHDWMEAKRWSERITNRPVQMGLYHASEFG